jgi:hypothetical protein
MSHAAAAVRAAGTRSGYRVATETPLQLGAHTPDALGVRCAGVRDPAVNRTMHQQPSHVAPSSSPKQCYLPGPEPLPWEMLGAVCYCPQPRRRRMPDSRSSSSATHQASRLSHPCSNPTRHLTRTRSAMRCQTPCVWSPHFHHLPICPPRSTATTLVRNPTPEALLTLSWTGPLLAAQAQLEPPSGQDGGFCLPQDPFHSYNGPSSAFGPLFLVAKKRNGGQRPYTCTPLSERRLLLLPASLPRH